jgi:hypothetical protein
MHEIVCSHRPCFILTNVQGPITTKEQALYEGGSELKRMKSLAETELHDNKLEFKRRRGDPVSQAFVSVTSSGKSLVLPQVVYGQIVQLRHVATKRFLRASAYMTSKLEPRYAWSAASLQHAYAPTISHLRVDLDQDVTKLSLWRIQPRFKVRTEGDRIRINDQVGVSVWAIRFPCYSSL